MDKFDAQSRREQRMKYMPKLDSKRDLAGATPEKLTIAEWRAVQ